MFKLTISKHVSRIVPPQWRNTFMLSWLESLLIPIRTLNDSFLAWVEARRIELTYNGQTIHLERMLNDLFDAQLRRIKVIHSTDQREYDYYYPAEGQQPDFDYWTEEGAIPRYLYFSFEYDSFQIDGFQVNVPLDLAPLEDQIKGQVLRYRIATMHYNLFYI